MIGGRLTIAPTNELSFSAFAAIRAGHSVDIIINGRQSQLSPTKAATPTRVSKFRAHPLPAYIQVKTFDTVHKSLLARMNSF